MNKKAAIFIWTVIAAIFALVIGMAETVDLKYDGNEPFEVHHGYAVRVESPAVTVISGESDGFFMLRSDNTILAEATDFNTAKPYFKVRRWAFSGEYFWVNAEPYHPVRLEVKAKQSVVITTIPGQVEKFGVWVIVIGIVYTLWWFGVILLRFQR